MMMSSKVFLLKVIIFAFFFKKSLQANTTKNILVVLIPDGSGTNNEIKALYDYSISKSEENIHYYVIIHKKDLHFWDNKYNNTNYFYYPYGDEDLKSIYDDSPQSIISERLISFTNDFVKSGIIQKLKNIKINYQMIQTDIPNYISVLLKNEFNIEKFVYLSHRPLPQLFYQNIEMNPSYYPSLFSSTRTHLNFFERLINFYSNIRNNYMFETFQGDSLKILKNNGYQVNSTFFVFDSLTMMQYPEGIGFSLSKPPNLIFLNLFISEAIESINSTESNNNDYIFISKKIQNKINIEKLNIFKEVKILNDPQVLFNDKIRKNVRLAFVYTEIYEVGIALLNEIPLVLYHDNDIQNSLSSFIIEKEYGIVIDKKDSYEKISQTLEKIIHDKNGTSLKSQKLAKILKSNKNSKEVYFHWINYGFKHGYSNLVISIYEKGNILSKSGLDVVLFTFGIILFVIYSIYYIVTFFTSSCTRKKQKKLKKE